MHRRGLRPSWCPFSVPGVFREAREREPPAGPAGGNHSSVPNTSSTILPNSSAGLNS
jgi:hypothetical protein